MNAVIKSTGAFYPEIIQSNAAFLQTTFLKKGNIEIAKAPSLVIEKFESITEIKERRIAKPTITSSDMGYLAALEAIENGQVDKETIDYIIVAHNWGDVSTTHNYYDAVPNIAARIKGKLQIKNPNCVAYDILFGCPGWLEAMKQAHLFIKSGEANRVLIIGTETVSRVAEKSDIDSMLFSDGAGAAILEKTTEDKGILACRTVSHCGEELDYLKMDTAYDPALKDTGFYLKMEGRKVFRYGMEEVPKVINACLQKAGVQLADVRYLVMHQANAKMIKQMVKKLFDIHGIKEYNKDILPINVDVMGNNSVATIPTVLHELANKKFNTRGIQAGDIVAFASVGAGMHANCVLHKF